MELKINTADVNRYIGQKIPDSNVNEMINTCSLEMAKKIKPNYVYKSFDINRASQISLGGTSIILEGQDIKAHLEGCHRALLVAVTLGVAAEKEIARAEYSDLVKSLILDAVATSYVESLLNYVTEIIKTENKYITFPFSPGYGDLPISLQKNIIGILNAEKLIGLTLTESNIMLPRKSITAVIGISKMPVTGKLAGCKSCKLKAKCQYRKEGIFCEN